MCVVLDLVRLCMMPQLDKVGAIYVSHALVLWVVHWEQDVDRSMNIEQNLKLAGIKPLANRYRLCSRKQSHNVPRI
jgi:hypothetical protein